MPPHFLQINKFQEINLTQSSNLDSKHFPTKCFWRNLRLIDDLFFNFQNEKKNTSLQNFVKIKIKSFKKLIYGRSPYISFLEFLIFHFLENFTRLILFSFYKINILIKLKSISVHKLCTWTFKWISKSSRSIDFIGGPARTRTWDQYIMSVLL